MRLKNSNTWRKHTPSVPRRILTKDYYSGAAVKKKSRVKKIIAGIFILLLAQAFFQMKFFRLQKFELETNQDLAIDDIQPALDEVLGQRRFLIFKNSNYFLFNKSVLADKLIADYNLDQVELDKSFPQTLKIKLQEKVSQFIWHRDNKFFLLDAHGQVNRQVGEASEEYLLLEDQRVNAPGEGQILSPDELNRINQLYIAWLADMPSLKLTKIDLNDDLSVLRVQTQPGYYLLFDPTDDLKIQLENLKKVLAGNIVGQDIDYIDLRFGERVYFK